MTRASFLLLALSLVLPSCKSVSLGGSVDDAGAQPGGGSDTAAGGGGYGGTGNVDAPSMGGQGGGATGSCGPRNFDADCAFGSATYTCVATPGGWAWMHTCPEAPKDGGQSLAQHPYVSTGAACINYPTSGYRSFPEDPSIQDTNNGEPWPQCPRNCTILTEISGANPYGPPDQALPAGACDDEGATCGMGANAWCPPCANVGGPYNGYTCVCRGRSWHCAVSPIKGMNMCGMPTCIDPTAATKPSYDCLKTTWTDTQVCACGVCRDLCDSDAQCPSGRCKLNQVCRFPDNCTDPDKCTAPCRGLCEPGADAGADAPSCSGSNPAERSCRSTTSDCIPSSCTCAADGQWRCTTDCRSLPICNDAGAPDAAAAICPGPNRAERTCRSSASDCVPSVCTCRADGQWECTADCRSLPLCADGGAEDTCSQVRIDNAMAATVLSHSIRQRIADIPPTMTFEAEEKVVSNLWETMQAQLFFGKIRTKEGSVWQEAAFLYRKCVVTFPTEDLWLGLIDSGVVSNGAFYYSWGSGSGIYRSNLGKLAPDGTTLAKTTSPSYFNPSSGPPGLVVSAENGRLVVYRAAVNWATFNEWTNPEPMGFLKDFGDRLAVVDEKDKELSTTLP